MFDYTAMIRQFIILLLVVAVATELNAQAIRFKNLSRSEKIWVYTHPFIAKKSFRITIKAMEITNEVAKDKKLDGDINGGQVDAFRHAYWMALLSQKINSHKAYKLGLAHEKGNKRDFYKRKLEEGTLPDSLSSVMDMENNKAGIVLGKTNKKMNEGELKNLVTNEISAGKMKILMKDKAGNYLLCDGSMLITTQWQGKWNIPKCLVNSDHKRK